MQSRLSVAVIALAVAASAAAQETVKIGVVQPLTGPVAYDGNIYVNTVKMLVDDMNAKGGVLGKKIELVVEDGACNPAQSVNAAEKLVTRDKVVALLGAFCSTSSAAMMEVARKHKVPHLTAISTAAQLTEQNNPYFFRAVATTPMLGAAFGGELPAAVKGKRFAFLVINDDWGRSMVSSYPKPIEHAGGQIVGTEFFQSSDLQFLPYITKIKAANPDAIILAANTQHAVALSKQIRELGITKPLIGEGSWTSDSYLKLAGPAAEGVYGLVEYVYTIKNPINAAFVKMSREKLKDNPSKFAGAAHNAIHIMVDAIRRAGAADPEKIRAALTKTDYHGLVGNIRFNEKNQAYGQDVYLARVTHGVPEVVKTAKIAKP
ncbi:MAG: ABC transporter substrate-binding protein [Betaproteobacteria bacterium]|nr:MAG: ABC transporter substrate-binding protein [Betaproteobacteria bacterium]